MPYILVCSKYDSILIKCFQHHTVGILQRLEHALTANAMSHTVSKASHINGMAASAYFSLLNSVSPSGGSSVIDVSHKVLHDFIVLMSSMYLFMKSL